MDPKRRAPFNAAFSDALFAKFVARMEAQVGHIPFAVAETPLFVTHELRDRLVKHASEIVAQLSRPEVIARLKAAVPARFDVPRMDALPNTAQVDFALVQGADGKLDGRLIELQGFPSLYALMPMMCDAWAQTLADIPGLKEDWTCFIPKDKRQGMELVRRTLLGGCAPEEVVLVDYQPEQQKTCSDFWATKQYFGIDSCCVTKLVVKGRSVFRPGPHGLIPVKRIYNRMVFDELEVKKVEVPFRWNDDLDVTWCSHPNWYWTWSKYSLPSLEHPAVPRSTFLSDLKELPQDLSRYVLKPLFSFAGAGVVIDVTPEEIAKVPAEQRPNWVLQEKIEYAPAIRMPDGNGVKAEVRVMFARPPDAPALAPAIFLVRLARGKMLGVDFNKGLTWVGGSVGMWPAG